MDICTTSTNPTGCGHYNLTVTVDGQAVALHVNDAELLEPLTASEREVFVRLSARRLRQKGVTLAQFLNRVVHGEEATNVKLYNLIGPGAAAAKTNTTTYTAVLTGLNAQRTPIDFTGCTEFYVVAHVLLAGTAPFRVRLVRHSDNAVLYENVAIGATGEREIDTGWMPLPLAAQGTLAFVRAESMSAAASSSCTWRQLTVGAR